MPIFVLLWTVALAQPNHPDPVIRGALELLTQFDSAPEIPIVVVTTRPPGISAIAAAWSTTDGPRVIYVATDSDAYRYAQESLFQPVSLRRREAFIPLAGIIAHEKAHWDGANEPAAYTKQVAVLRKLGASPRLIENVSRQIRRAN